MNIRPVSKKDYPLIDKYLNERSWERANKKWVNLIDPIRVGIAIKNNSHSIIVKETYLVLFAVTRPWFTDKTLIEEKLVFRLMDGPGKFSDVVTALEHIAAKLDASGIFVGTGLAPNDAVMARMFQRTGFEPSQIGLFKNMEYSDGTHN